MNKLIETFNKCNGGATATKYIEAKGPVKVFSE